MRLRSVFDKPKKGLLTGSGPLIAFAIAAVMLLGVGGPTSAQFFNFGGFQRQQPQQRGGGWFGGGWFGNDTSGPFQQRAPQPRWERRRASTPVHEDFSKAPPPEKRDTVPERNVLVLGDAMADWLAYGLEDAYTEQPDIGVIRKVKAVSGLIQYQPKGAPADWTAAARGILANEKPDVIVVMMGLNDRMTITEWEPERSMGIEHRGLVTGQGRFRLQGFGDRTRFTWTEQLQFPWWLGGRVGALAAKPVLRHVWRRNLRTLAALVEGT